MTKEEKVERLYGRHKPHPIPFEIKDDRIYNLKCQLAYLVRDTPMDSPRVLETKEAIKFWEDIL